MAYSSFFMGKSKYILIVNLYGFSILHHNVTDKESAEDKIYHNSYRVKLNPHIIHSTRSDMMILRRFLKIPTFFLLHTAASYTNIITTLLIEIKKKIISNTQICGIERGISYNMKRCGFNFAVRI